MLWAMPFKYFFFNLFVVCSNINFSWLGMNVFIRDVLPLGSKDNLERSGCIFAGSS